MLIFTIGIFYTMQIIKTDITEQNIKILPRELVSDVAFYLVDKEQESNVIDENITVTNSSGFMTIPFTASFFKEGRKYFIKVSKLTGERIWQGLALCTDKTDLQNYNINE